MNGKSNLRDKAKSLWIKGMKAVGNTAASIANNTRYKVDEVTIQNRRREVMNDLAYTAYALWLKGEQFPEQMDKMMKELNQLDEQLNDMRAEKYALTNESELASEEETAPNQTEDDELSPVIPEDSSVSTEINDLFDSSSSVGRTAEKVNSTLDQMSDRIKHF